jgi:FkbM family methyltransferase
MIISYLEVMFLEHRIIFGGVEMTVAGQPGDAYFANLAGHGKEVASLEWALDKAVPNAPVMLDVGANIGAVATMLAKRRPEGQLYCVEASPRAFNCLNETLRMNEVGNCQTRNVAVGSETGTLSFSERDMLANSHAAVAGLDEGRTITVELQKINDIVAQLELTGLDFIKIDVEGMELEALQGARVTIGRFRPIIALEVNTYALIAIRNVTPISLLNEPFDQSYQ